MITPGTPSAPDSPWATPVQASSPVVSGIVATDNEVPETPDPIFSPGPSGAKGDDVSATVAGAVANAEQRFLSHQQDTYGLGSRIGVPLDLPPVVSDSSKHTGGSDARSFDPAG